MWFLTALFQSIGQALSWVFPISENLYSSMFHEFSNRLTGTCSELTGLVHIGIGIGIIISFYKLFFKLIFNFFGTFSDVAHKRLEVKNPRPIRHFMFMTILSFLPMLLYVVPAGKYGNFYGLLKFTCHNGSLLEDGMMLFILGITVLFANGQVGKTLNNRKVDVVSAVILGFASMFSLPVPGLSVFGMVFCLGIMLGISRKNSIRYAAVMSAPTLIVVGIVEICKCVTYVNIISGIVAILLSVIVTFVSIKVFMYIASAAKMHYFAYYDFGMGAICIIIGIVQLFSQR